MSTILITGGAGFIGSHVNLALQHKGFKTVVLDDLSTGNRAAVTRGTFIEGTLQDRKLLQEIFQKYSIGAVCHLAACIDVGESVSNPAKYYLNNVVHTLTLLDAMREHRIDKLIFSSTAAVYGFPQKAIIDETHPLQPINPYGESKRMVEALLRDYDRAYRLRFICLRYFNAAGRDPTGEIPALGRNPSNLIPIALQTLNTPEKVLTIFGTDYATPDGTCVRDYIHVADLASAHGMALEKLFLGAESGIYNLGNGAGFSVRQVVAALEKVTKNHFQIVEGARRLGDPAYLIADARLAKRELGWCPKRPALETMIQDVLA